MWPLRLSPGSAIVRGWIWYFKYSTFNTLTRLSHFIPYTSEVFTSVSFCGRVMFMFYYLSIAMAYSMGQIIKSVCVSLSVCVSVYPSANTLMVAFRDRFSQKLVQT